MNWENIIIEIGIITAPAILTFVAGIIIGSWNERRQLQISSYKEQLSKFYEPLFLVIEEQHFKYGAHHFSDLPPKEQEHVLNIIKENLTYANSSVYVTYMELRWSIKEHDEQTNEIFIHLEKLIFSEYYSLRKKLKLPEIDIDKAKRFID